MMMIMVIILMFDDDNAQKSSTTMTLWSKYTPFKYYYLVKKGPKQPGRGWGPPPLNGQCLFKNVFFFRTPSLILPVLEDEQGQTLPRIILSAAEILLHPRQISTPAHLAKLHPKISLFRSRLTNRLLCAGTLGSNSPPGGRQK